MPSSNDVPGLRLDPHMLVEALDSLDEGIQVLSRDWRYLYVNEAAARHGRTRPEELLGSSMLECYPGIDRTPVFATLLRCRDGGQLESLENEFTFPDGALGWFELRIRPFSGGIVIASLDITERKLIERRLQESYAQALRDLVTPVLRIHDRVLLVPLVGALDDRRASELVENVLTRVSDEGARVVIFDVAGVPSPDTSVAHHLLQATAMVRMLGAEVVLTGIGPATARAMVHLGVDLGTMQTTTTLAQGIQLALQAVGCAVQPRARTAR